MLCKTIRELAVTIREIWNRANIDKNVTDLKKQLIYQKFIKIVEENIFSICGGILMHVKWVVIEGALKKYY